MTAVSPSKHTEVKKKMYIVDHRGGPHGPTHFGHTTRLVFVFVDTCGSGFGKLTLRTFYVVSREHEMRTSLFRLDSGSRLLQATKLSLEKIETCTMVVNALIRPRSVALATISLTLVEGESVGI